MNENTESSPMNLPESIFIEGKAPKSMQTNFGNKVKGTQRIEKVIPEKSIYNSLPHPNKKPIINGISGYSKNLEENKLQQQLKGFLEPQIIAKPYHSPGRQRPKDAIPSTKQRSQNRTPRNFHKKVQNNTECCNKKVTSISPQKTLKKIAEENDGWMGNTNVIGNKIFENSDPQRNVNEKKSDNLFKNIRNDNKGKILKNDKFDENISEFFAEESVGGTQFNSFNIPISVSNKNIQEDKEIDEIMEVDEQNLYREDSMEPIPSPLMSAVQENDHANGKKKNILQIKKTEIEDYKAIVEDDKISDNSSVVDYADLINGKSIGLRPFSPPFAKMENTNISPRVISPKRNIEDKNNFEYVRKKTLVYDPILKCYYDPNNGKYYQPE